MASVCLEAMKKASQRMLSWRETEKTKNEISKMQGRREEKQINNLACSQDWDQSEASQVVDGQEINTVKILGLRVNTRWEIWV